MNFKKLLRSQRAQSIVEYIVTFIVLAAGAIAVFGAFNPETTNLKTAFDTAITKSMVEINKQTIP